MDFSRFAAEYRQRTAMRMENFEKMIAEHHRQMEMMLTEQRRAAALGYKRQPVVIPQGGERLFPIRRPVQGGIASIRTEARPNTADASVDVRRPDQSGVLEE
ncbi:hypothetical protein BJP08_09440 [Corynebacterium sp. NML140438]|uniref:hypothetical protein n=1 Tax=Corynebacterium sp. NML140438 TaxID=1906334 RepID=UPI0008FAF340|nr:hypothetical protein [Corynebacterium sp. NML140438]OIR40708.1 hypothetical protein BJP08_09440 [Corynebacterium sp. NML140438]